MVKTDINEAERLKLINQALDRGARILPDPVAKLARFFCGCGEPEEAWLWVLDHLRRLEKPYEEGSSGWSPESGAEWIAAYLLDHLKLTEHGSNVRVGWVTAEGKELVSFLETEGVDWFENSEWIDSEGVSWI